MVDPDLLRDGVFEVVVAMACQCRYKHVDEDYCCHMRPLVDMLQGPGINMPLRFGKFMMGLAASVECRSALVWGQNLVKELPRLLDHKIEKASYTNGPSVAFDKDRNSQRNIDEDVKTHIVETMPKTKMAKHVEWALRSLTSYKWIDGYGSTMAR